MKKERRQKPRVNNKGIVKRSHIIAIEYKGKKELIDFEVVNASKDGIRGKVKNPGNFRFDVEEDLPVTIQVVFNNELTITIGAKIVWYKDFGDNLEFGLQLSDSIW